MNKLESVEGVINAMLLLETAYGDMPEELDGVFGKLMVLRDAEDLDEEE